MSSLFELVALTSCRWKYPLSGIADWKWRTKFRPWVAVTDVIFIDWRISDRGEDNNIYRQFFVTWSFFIFFDHHFIPDFWVYIMDPRCFIYWQFPWYCVCFVCKGINRQINCCKRPRISSFPSVFFLTVVLLRWFCYTKAWHKMAEAGVYKITNGDMVQTWHAFLE